MPASTSAVRAATSFLPIFVAGATSLGCTVFVPSPSATRVMLLGERPELQRIDAMRVKGRREEVVIYAPVSTADEPLAQRAS